MDKIVIWDFTGYCSYTNHVRWANYASIELQISYSVYVPKKYENWL